MSSIFSHGLDGKRRQKFATVNWTKRNVERQLAQLNQEIRINAYVERIRMAFAELAEY